MRDRVPLLASLRSLWPFDRGSLSWCVDAAALFVFFLFLYGATHDRIYSFDSVIYAGVIEHPLWMTGTATVFEWNHPLWYTAARLFYVLIALCGYAGRTYASTQWFNSIAGAGGLVVVYCLLRRATERGWALAFTCLAGFSGAYWARSTGGEPYLWAAVWTIAFIAALSDYWLSPTLVGTFAAMGCLCLATGFHIASLVLLPVFVACVVRRGERAQRIVHLASASLILAALLVPYGLVNGIFQPGGLRRWWTWGSGLVNGVVPRESRWGQFDFHLLRDVSSALKTFCLSWMAPAPDVALAAATGAGLLTLGFALARRGISPEEGEPERQSLRAVAGLTSLCLLALFAIWQPGNLIYWAAPFVSVVIWAGAAGYRRTSRWTSALAIFAAALLGAAHNFVWSIHPNEQGVAVRPYVSMATIIGQVTPAESRIVISGVGAPLLKPYIPYFSGRRRLAVELYAIQLFGKNVDPARELAGTVRDLLDSGVPVYITEDVMTSSHSFTAWGSPPESVAALWSPYRRFLVARFNDTGNALYLLWSDDASPAAEDQICAKLERDGFWHQLEWVYERRLDVHPTAPLRASLADVRHRLSTLPTVAKPDLSVESPDSRR